MRQIFISFSLMVYIDHKLHDSVYSCCADLENYRPTFFFISLSFSVSLAVCVDVSLISVSHLKSVALIDGWHLNNNSEGRTVVK